VTIVAYPAGRCHLHAETSVRRPPLYDLHLWLPLAVAGPHPRQPP